MKYRYWPALLVNLAVILLVSNVGVTQSSFVDTESSSGNTFTAFNSTLWAQTTQADFNAGVLNNVDILSSPGDVKLAVRSDWYNAGWGYRKKITIDHTKVSNTSQSNFPVLISRTDTDWKDTTNGGHVGKSNGGDILFTSSDGTTKLSHEIESYTASTGNLTAWVKVPALSYTTDTVIYIYYGNATCADQWATDGSTWDSNFKMVQHMKDASTTTIADSTTYADTGTKQAVGHPVEATGEVGKAQNFNGTADYVGVTQNGNFNLSGSAFTVETWVLDNTAYASLGTYHRIVSWYDGSKNIQLGLGQNNVSPNRMFYVTNGSANAKAMTAGDITSGWHHVTATFDGSTYKIYLDGTISNGAQYIRNDIVLFSANSVTLYIGQRGDGGAFVLGLIDEVRISNIARSADWIKTEYNNQNSPSTFYTVGAEEGKYVSSGTVASQVRDTAIAGARWDALFWNATLPSNTNLTFEVRASDTSFLKDATTPTWTSMGGTSPVTSGLPKGQYMQWRATLTTSDTSTTPTLNEVRIYYH